MMLPHGFFERGVKWRACVEMTSRTLSMEVTLTGQQATYKKIFSSLFLLFVTTTHQIHLRFHLTIPTTSQNFKLPSNESSCLTQDARVSVIRWVVITSPSVRSETNSIDYHRSRRRRLQIPRRALSTRPARLSLVPATALLALYSPRATSPPRRRPAIVSVEALMKHPSRYIQDVAPHLLNIILTRIVQGKGVLGSAQETLGNAAQSVQDTISGGQKK